MGDANVQDQQTVRREQRGSRVSRAALMAVVVGIVFQARTMAYNNYSLWRPTFSLIEVGVGFVAALLAGHLWTNALEERTVRWAASYVPEETGRLWWVLRQLPQAAFCAAVMTALLSIANVCVVAPMIYREELGFIPVAVLMRFLADLPAAVALCLAAPPLAAWVRARRHRS